VVAHHNIGKKQLQLDMQARKTGQISQKITILSISYRVAKKKQQFFIRYVERNFVKIIQPSIMIILLVSAQYAYPAKTKVCPKKNTTHTKKEEPTTPPNSDLLKLKSLGVNKNKKKPETNLTENKPLLKRVCRELFPDDLGDNDKNNVESLEKIFTNIKLDNSEKIIDQNKAN
jgi:hypothetical protein